MSGLKNLMLYSSSSPYNELRFVSNKVGGAEINLRLLAETLADQNVNCNYLSKSFIFPRNTKINNVNVYHYPDYYLPIIHKHSTIIKDYNDKIIFSRRQRKIRKICKKEDIQLIHLYNAYPDAYLSINAVKDLDIKISKWIVGRDWYNKISEKPELKKKIEWTFNNIDIFIFNSEFIRDITLEYWNELDFNIDINYKILDTGIDFRKVNLLNSDNIIKKYGINPNETNFLCIQSFKNYSKRQDLLIKSIPNIIKENDKIKIIFIGSGINLIKNRNLAEKLGVDKNVKFLGSIPNEDVLSLISLSDFIIHPTEFEGLSTVMKEAMAQGRIFIGSDIKSISDFIVDGHNGFLIKNDHLNISEKINDILSNNYNLDKIQKNSYNCAKKNFDHYKNSMEFKKIFDNYQE